MKNYYIYIITNPSYPGWIKIGRSINPEKRLNSYQTNSPFRDYKMPYKVSTKYATKIEIYISTILKNNGYEWYKCDVKKGIKIIKEIIELLKKDPKIIDNVTRKNMPGYKYKYTYIVNNKKFNSINELSEYLNIDKYECTQAFISIQDDYIYINKYKVTKIFNNFQFKLNL